MLVIINTSMRMHFVRLTHLGLAVTVVSVTLWKLIPVDHCASELRNSCPCDRTIDGDTLVNFLISLHKELKSQNVSETLLQQTAEIIRVLSPDQSPKEETFEKRNSLEKLEVCPEVWLGPKGGYPYYFAGWQTLNCSDVLPFEKVITVILYYQHQEKKACPLQFQRVLAGIKSLYPKIRVLVSGVSEGCATTDGASSLVQWISDANAETPGPFWNELVEHVLTPYVLVGRDLDDFLWTTNLEREVRMISYNLDISVAGGAVRNFTGHWKVGCWQSSIHNYVLEYKEGYYKSVNSCMFCDHLTGPFVARTKVLTSIKFDESLPADILFEDWFWRVRQEAHKVVNCPDVMYSASDATSAQKNVDRIPWMPLAEKWGLNRIVVPWGPTFSYSCSEAGLTCNDISTLTNSFLIPVCCIEQFATAIGTFNAFCREHNVRYEMDGGSVLGLVKMNDMLPWDLDGDITMYTSNTSFYESSAAYFKAYGIILKDFGYLNGNPSSYFSLHSPDLYIEMWGSPELSHDMSFGRPFLSVPTQVELHGHWVYAPHSPGNYARNRYGIEVLRHAHSWLQMDKNSSYEPYISGHFKKCIKPKHHACLDRFSVDGNIQFQVPS